MQKAKRNGRRGPWVFFFCAYNSIVIKATKLLRQFYIILNLNIVNKGTFIYKKNKYNIRRTSKYLSLIISDYNFSK